MGSGPRFKYGIMEEVVGLGMSYSTFPFKHTFRFMLIKFYVKIGFGKGYDEE